MGQSSGHRGRGSAGNGKVFRRRRLGRQRSLLNALARAAAASKTAKLLCSPVKQPQSRLQPSSPNSPPRSRQTEAETWSGRGSAPDFETEADADTGAEVDAEAEVIAEAEIDAKTLSHAPPSSSKTSGESKAVSSDSVRASHARSHVSPLPIWRAEDTAKNVRTVQVDAVIKSSETSRAPTRSPTNAALLGELPDSSPTSPSTPSTQASEEEVTVLIGQARRSKPMSTDAPDKQLSEILMQESEPASAIKSKIESDHFYHPNKRKESSKVEPTQTEEPPLNPASAAVAVPRRVHWRKRLVPDVFCMPSHLPIAKVSGIAAPDLEKRAIKSALKKISAYGSRGDGLFGKLVSRLKRRK